MRGVHERGWRYDAIGALCASVVTFGAARYAAAQPMVPVCGDADLTETVTVTDGVQILRAAAALVGPCGEYADRCDLDSDGRISVSDGVAALQVAAALPNTVRCDRGMPRACDLPATPTDLGRRADFPPSLALGCGVDGDRSSSNYAMPLAALDPDAAEELHVIAVYEGDAPDGHATGTVQVHVRRRAKPVSLFLSAEDPVRWELTLDPDAKMGRVIVQGNGEQQVDGVPAGVPVVSWSPLGGFGCMYGWEVERNSGGCNYWSLIDQMRVFAGTTESSFQGCYHGQRFEIPLSEGQPRVCRTDLVSGNESLPLAAVSFPGCEAVTAEDTYCLTTTEDFASSTRSFAVLGLESGRVCPVGPIDPALTLYDEARSLAWRGEVAYLCADQGLVRLSLRDGTWEAAQLPCQAVVGTDEALFVARSFRDPLDDHSTFGRIDEYDSYEAVISGRLREAHVLPQASRLAVTGDRLFGAWFATDHVDVLDLASGQELDPIMLEDYDDWIDGLAVTTDGVLVVSLGISPDQGYVVLFDAKSGARLRDLVTDRSLVGLACVTRSGDDDMRATSRVSQATRSSRGAGAL